MKRDPGREGRKGRPRRASRVRPGSRYAAALLALAVSFVHAAGDATVVEQKLRLLEGYFSSATAERIINGGNARATDALSRARGLVVDARDALSDGDAARARSLADDALRSFTAATRMARQPESSSSAERTRYEELRGAIASFREILTTARRTGATGSGPGIDLPSLDAETARADSLAEGGYHARANAVLVEVYQGAMASIAAARGGETVVYRLEFETPADEFEYENERFRGNELLLEMLLSGGASDNAKTLARRFREQAQARRDAAMAQAAQDDVPGAIASMEEASALLARALRTLGMSL